MGRAVDGVTASLTRRGAWVTIGAAMAAGSFDQLKSRARARVPASARGVAADLGFLLEVLVSRMTIDRHRAPLRPGDIDAEALSNRYDVAEHAASADEYFGAGLDPQHVEPAPPHT